jgi:hypothetical protein
MPCLLLVERKRRKKKKRKTVRVFFSPRDRHALLAVMCRVAVRCN